MKYRSLMVVSTVCFLVYASLFNGCASQMSVEDRTKEWIARPLSELKQEMNSPDSYASKIGWKETTYPLANGDLVYVEPVSADCSIHWEINQSGMIIGYQAKGSGCVQAKEADTSIRNTQMK